MFNESLHCDGHDDDEAQINDGYEISEPEFGMTIGPQATDGISRGSHVPLHFPQVVKPRKIKSKQERPTQVLPRTSTDGLRKQS